MADQDTDFTVQAKEMGWVDRDEFRGDESKWVDAKEFVERAEHFMPLLRAQNGRMKEQLLTRDKEINTLKQTLTEVQKAQSVMQKHYDESVKTQVDQAKKDLVAQIKQAREEGDVDLEVVLQDKLGELRDAQRVAKEKSDDVPAKTTTGQVDENNFSPEYVKWEKENAWAKDYSTPESRKRIREFIRIGEDLRDEGDTTTGREFMDKCVSILEEREGKSTKQDDSGNKRQASKVEGGSSGRQTRSARGFDSLSKEAKDVCHSDNDRFVGPGKLFKTVKEWEDHFYQQISED